MNAKYLYIVLVSMVLAVVVSIGFSESFQYRPTETEMDELVTLGTESGHGVYERCYATQTSTNPTYSVSPPSFIGQNGWYLSPSVIQTLDSKAQALVSCYLDSDTVYEGTPNISSLTITGLWAHLGIGDHTDKFTGTPAIGTNPPTYGDYPWRPYTESLDERYKVLNAFEWSLSDRTRCKNGSTLGTFINWTEDMVTHHFSNTVDHTLVDAYWDNWQAYVLGKNIYEDYVTNNPPLQEFWPNTYYKFSYSEAKTIIGWWWNHYDHLSTRPYTSYTNGYVAPTNLTDGDVHSYVGIWKSVSVSEDGEVLRWYWNFVQRTSYSTWEFTKDYPSNQIENTVALYIKPTVIDLPTTPPYQVWPPSWNVDTSCDFEELAGKATNVYTELDSSFFTVIGGNFEVVFGSDQFEPIAGPGSFPTWPGEPVGEGPAEFRGLSLLSGDYKYIKKWQFNYCTDEY